MTVATKILMGSGAVVDPVDDDFNTVAFLSHFDGANNGVNNAFDDSSATDHTVSVNNDVTQGSFSPYSPAYGIQAVNGVTQNRKFALSTIANAYGAWTVEWWFIADAASVNWQQMITEWDNGSVSQQCWEVFVSGGFIRTYVRDSGSNSYSSDLSGVSAAAVTSGKWHYLSVSDDGSNFRVHLDGALIQKDSRVPQSGSTGRFMIGFDQATTTFAGTLADVKVSDVSRYTDSTYSVPTAVGGLVDSDTLLLVGGNNARDLRGNYAASLAVAYPVVPTAQVGRVEAYDSAVNGASAFFDGTADYLTVPTSSDFAFGTGDFTIDFWYFSVEKKIGIWIDFRANSSEVAGVLYQNPAGNIDWYDNANSHVVGDNATPFNEWGYITMSRVSGTTKLFLNGTSITSFSDSKNYVSSGPVVIGLTYDNSYGFHGYMSDLRVVKGSGISSNFTAPTAPLTAITNTKLLLNMADGQAFDSAAFNNMTLYGNANTSTDQAKFGDTSLHLDGTPQLGDYAEVTSNMGAWGTGNFTVEGWYYLTAQAQYDNLFDFRTSGNTSHLDLYFDDDPFRLHVFFGGADRINANAATPTNEWVHVAVVRNGSTTTLYQNGTSLGTSTTVTTFTEGALRIGNRYAGDYYMNGYVDEFRVSKFARYTSNFTAPTKPFPDTGP